MVPFAVSVPDVYQPRRADIRRSQTGRGPRRACSCRRPHAERRGDRPPRGHDGARPRARSAIRAIVRHDRNVERTDVCRGVCKEVSRDHARCGPRRRRAVDGQQFPAGPSARACHARSVAGGDAIRQRDRGLFAARRRGAEPSGIWRLAEGERFVRDRCRTDAHRSRAHLPGGHDRLSGPDRAGISRLLRRTHGGDAGPAGAGRSEEVDRQAEPRSAGVSPAGPGASRPRSGKTPYSCVQPPLSGDTPALRPRARRTCRDALCDGHP